MDILLGLIIFALLLFVAWREKHFTEERQQLLTAVLSKNAKEFVQVISTPQKVEPKFEPPPEFQAMDSLTDDEFVAAIEKNNQEGVDLNG